MEVEAITRAGPSAEMLELQLSCRMGILSLTIASPNLNTILHRVITSNCC